MNSNAIGIFDSGVGGLTVVKEVISALPNEDIIYFGDTARVPYGSKSKETVTKFSKQIVNFLLTKNVKLIIIACGTVSSNSYADLTEAFQIPIVEMVSHGAMACSKATKNKKVGIIATEGTIKSKAYERALSAIDSEISVFSKACPLFVPLVEEGWTQNSIAQLTTEIYLQEMIDKKIDSLVLACTHYPLLIDCIRKAVGGINIINPAKTAAEWVKNYLRENDMERSLSTNPNYNFYVSDNTEKFNRTCRLVLESSYDAEIVDIDPNSMLS